MTQEAVPLYDQFKYWKVAQPPGIPDLCPAEHRLKTRPIREISKDRKRSRIARGPTQRDSKRSRIHHSDGIKGRLPDSKPLRGSGCALSAPVTQLGSAALSWMQKEESQIFGVKHLETPGVLMLLMFSSHKAGRLVGEPRLKLQFKYFSEYQHTVGTRSPIFHCNRICVGGTR
jgi:hypothetical protein